jgi:hypothetical protein
MELFTAVLCNLGGKVVMAGAKMQLRQETTSASPFLVVHPLEATMKKTVILCGALLAFSAAAAFAAPGSHVAWNDCSSAGLHDMTFACNTNAAAQSHTFVVSFTAPAGITAYVSNQSTVFVESTTPALPDWWAVKGTGQCRNNSAVGSADFSAGPFSCIDLWTGTASGALASYNVGFLDANRGRMNLVFAVPGSGASALDEGSEYYAFKVQINNAKTTGAGSCAGCATPVVVRVHELQVQQPSGTPGGNTVFNDSIDPVGNCCTWNDSAPDACVPVVATKNATWGSIKSLYR